MKLITPLAGLCAGCLLFCGRAPLDEQHTGLGSLELHAWINKPPQLARSASVQQTVWNRLVVQISAAGMAVVRDTFSLDPGKSWETVSLSGVSAGSDRSVEAWTLDAAGDTIHGIATATVDISPSTIATVTLELFPLKGSIYFSLASLPTTIDSVAVLFQTAERLWQLKAKRESRLYLSLDKIPFGSRGTLSIQGYAAGGAVVASWSRENYTFVNALETIEASFVNHGGTALAVTIQQPGLTLVKAVMDGQDSLGPEKGGLIISEIMYAANDSEYVEIYNPGARFDDTLIVQMDMGAWMYFELTIEPGQFVVIGRDASDDLFWVDTCPPGATALNLSSSGGNWLVLRARDSSVIDWVAFEAGSNSQEWPVFSGKQSIVLDSLCSDPLYNNYGRHWRAAQAAIDSGGAPVTLQRGTPGRAGS